MIDFPHKEPLCFAPPALFRNVSGNLGHAQNTACLVLDRGHCERDVDQRAILASTPGFEMVQALAAPDTSEDQRFLTMTLGRNDLEN